MFCQLFYLPLLIFSLVQCILNKKPCLTWTDPLKIPEFIPWETSCHNKVVTGVANEI